jgi:dCMP deaminase
MTKEDEPLGPECFGGTDEESHYMSTAAKPSIVPSPSPLRDLVAGLKPVIDGSAKILNAIASAEASKSPFYEKTMEEERKEMIRGIAEKSDKEFTRGPKVLLPHRPARSDKRPSKTAGYMAVAEAVALRATCLRRKVGALVIANDRIVATGYNGSPRGMPHCLDVGCEMEHGHCVRTVHAEANALLQCSAHGLSASGATLYTTASPCRACMSLIVQAEVQRVVYASRYRDPAHPEKDASAWAVETARKLGITMLFYDFERDMVVSE